MGLNVGHKGFADVTAKLTGISKAVRIAQYRAVNRVADKARVQGSKLIRQQLKLQAAYVNQNLVVNKRAKESEPWARIVGRFRPTRLARFGAKQLTLPAKAAQGDPRRKIKPGRKAAGVRVEVKPGRVRKMRRAFLLPLKNQGGGLMGVFTRTGPAPDAVRHHYGPSVYQAFKSVRGELKPFVRAELVKEFKAQYRFASQQAGA
jgi:hypothetical protein